MHTADPSMMRERREGGVSATISVVVLVVLGCCLVALAMPRPFGAAGGPWIAMSAWRWEIPLLLVLLALQIVRTVFAYLRPALRQPLAWANLGIQIVSCGVGWILVATRQFIAPEALQALGVPVDASFDPGFILSAIVLVIVTIIAGIDSIATLVRAARGSSATR